MASIASEISAASAAKQGAAAGRRHAWLREGLGWVAREPFFQFMVLGALLFAASEYLGQRASTPRIEITHAEVEGIENNYRLQYGASPTAQQLTTLVDQFVQEEVFYREAMRLGLDQDDEIVRRRLVQKYEFLQQDLGTLKDPAESDLHAYYRSHQKNYEIPERLTFSHVFFSVDRSREEEAKARAERALESLSRGGQTRAPADGDSFPGAVDYAGVTPTQVRRAFGSSALSEEIFKASPGAWAGPFRSGFGWHVVYVAAREAASVAPYEAVREAVRRDYIDALREARNAQAYDTLKKHYAIVLE
jgi:parvulin-like peptidyl-prolyl isomerase